jgi:hypothetical protein
MVGFRFRIDRYNHHRTGGKHAGDVTVKIKNYNQDKTIPGLPDTTNINDPQTRLFLDRVRQSFSELVLTVNGMQQEISPQYIANMLFSNQFFQDSLKDAVAKQYNSAARNNKNKNRQEKNLQRIIVDPPSMEINTYNGNIEYLNISYYPADVPYSQKGVTWSSSDINVATVDEDGTVTAVAVGECVITARSTYNTAFSDSADITVVYKEGTYITVSAPFAWCSTYDGTVYTEISQVESNSRAWRQSDNSVLIPPGIGEEYAKNTAAYTLVSSFEDRNYIIGEDGTVFWEDITYEPESIGSLQVHPAVLVGQDDVVNNYQFCRKDLWCENVIYGAWTADTTGRLFSKAYYEGGDPESFDAYRAEDCQLNVDPRNVMTFADAGIEYTHLARISKDSNDRYPYGYMLKTGATTTLPENPNMGVDTPVTYCEYVTFDGAKKCWLPKDYRPGPSEREIAALPSKPYWEEVADGIFEIKPDAHDEVGQIFTLRKIVGDCFKWTDGRYYYTARQSWSGGLIGYVYEFVRKWVTSPCHSGKVTTVYTGGESGKYYLAEEDAVNKSNALDIADKGSAAYSFTGKNGIEYYRSGAPQKSNDTALSVNVIDEEFE